MVMLTRQSERMVLLAEGRLSSIGLRMVIAALLYIPDRIVAVIDSSKESGTTQEIIGFGGDTPIVSSLEEAMKYRPDSMLIGITPMGGVLPDSWRHIIRSALHSGLHIVSGLKQPLRRDAEFSTIAEEKGLRIHDLHQVSKSHLIRAQGSWRRRGIGTILTVGTDSDTGKMTTALMLQREMRRRGINVAMVGTGPTGILISGRGVSVEDLPADFITGALEFEIDKAANEGYEYVIVEGQGAISNCGNSPIALGLMHGAMPDAMILCHHPSRETDGYGMPLPGIADSRELHERVMGVFKSSRIVAIGLNSMDLNTQDYRQTVARFEQETGLPTVDLMRDSAAPMVDALLAYFAQYHRVVLPHEVSEIHDRV
ncbi:MAG: DUF1611 domain-containing protein [Bacteroidetes bacterium]|nr:DUF1611 domain-containing protein [Bacteroidota bacterium]